MRNIFFQGFLIVAVFAGIYFALSQIDYVQAFHIKETADLTEQKLGDLFWEAIQKTETEIRNDSVNKSVEKIVARIADENHIDRQTIKVHVIRKDEINAFAMPNRYLIIYSGLIAQADNEGELAGVISHEMAHIEKNHVMKKLVKEIGLSVLLSITTGGKSPEIIREAARMLSSSAYDRDLESEADLTGADYMIKAHLDPAEMADFLYKMSADEQMPEQLYWISTHPELKARAEAIVHNIKGEKIDKKPVLTRQEWQSLKKLK